ncbi:MAG: TolC family protein [Myxococcales bacterium]|nr:MAG: TolC family protein [Myxococcales bacterium]
MSRFTAMVAVLVAILEPGVASAEVVTLQELEALALRNQAHWEAIKATTTRATAEVDAARARKLPTFWMDVMSVVAPGSDIERVETVDGREVNVRASPTVTERTAFRPNVRYEGTIQMRAPLYDGQTQASLRAARAYRAATQASAGASQEMVLNMVRTAYLDWLATYLHHGFAAASAREAQAQRRRTGIRVKDGERPPADLDAAHYQQLEAELVASDAAAKLEAAKRLLESAVGTELPPDAEPDRDLLFIVAEDPRLEQKWEIEALELERDAARDEADMYRKSRVPVLAVIGQTGLAGVNERVFPMYRLGLNLSVPLWDGGRAVSLARAADARASELDARARDARIERDDRRQQALIERRNAEEQLVLAESLVEISQRRVVQAETGYDLGAGDLDAVADARSALRDAQSRRLQIQVTRADAILRLNYPETQ